MSCSICFGLNRGKGKRERERGRIQAAGGGGGGGGAHDNKCVCAKNPGDGGARHPPMYIHTCVADELTLRPRTHSTSRQPDIVGTGGQFQGRCSVDISLYLDESIHDIESMYVYAIA